MYYGPGYVGSNYQFGFDSNYQYGGGWNRGLFRLLANLMHQIRHERRCHGHDNHQLEKLMRALKDVLEGDQNGQNKGVRELVKLAERGNDMAMDILRMLAQGHGHLAHEAQQALQFLSWMNYGGGPTHASA
jgi:hypothetical protein